MAVELVLITPLVVVLLLFVAFGGRVVRAEAAVRHAADRAARAASLRQAPAAATAAARSVALDELAASPLSCMSPTVTVDTGSLGPGGQVRVTVTCTARLGDLGLLGVPGSKRFSATSAEVIDARRGG